MNQSGLQLAQEIYFLSIIKGDLERIGLLDFENSTTTFNYLYDYISFCLTYIKDNIPLEWEKDSSEDGIITINNGIGGIIRTLNSIVQHLTDEKDLGTPVKLSAKELFDESKYYLDSIVRFYENVDQEKRETIGENLTEVMPLCIVVAV